jgi:cohesin complex subunit SA-1/2
LYLDATISTDEYAVALSKVLVSAFIKRGMQLHIIARVPSEHLVSVHTRSITWIVKQIQTYEGNANARMKRRAIAFFRVLAPLLTSVEGRDALKMCVRQFTPPPVSIPCSRISQ